MLRNNSIWIGGFVVALGLGVPVAPVSADLAGCNKCIEKQDIKGGAVVNSKIKKNAIKSNKIKDDTITEDDLDSGSVGTSELQSEAVTTSKIESGAVTSSEIADSAVTSSKIASEAVTSSKLSSSLSDDLDPCGPGRIRAYAQVQGVGLSSSFTTVEGYNCTGGTIEARRTATGTYRLRWGSFVFDSTTQGMVIHVTGVGGSGGTITGYGTAQDDLVVNTYDNTGSAVDKLFSVSVIDPGFVSP